MKDEAGLAQLFDEWTYGLDSEGWKLVQDHLRTLMNIKNMGLISAKGLLAKTIMYVHDPELVLRNWEIVKRERRLY